MRLKKTNRFVVIVALLSGGGAFAAPAEGGLDGSGGNGPQIKPEVVDKVVDLLPEFLPRIAARLGVIDGIVMANEPSPDEDPTESEQVFKAWFRDDRSSPLLDTLNARTIRFVSQDTCLHDGKNSDAGYSNGVICFNRQKLSKNSTAGMVRNVLYLAFHELAHHFGFDEKLAQAVQKDLASSDNLWTPGQPPVATGDRAALESKLALLKQDLEQFLPAIKLYLAAQSSIKELPERGEVFSLEIFLEDHNIFMMNPEDDYSRP